MEKIIEMPISVNYCKHWTLAEALRELWQNAIDREKETEKKSFIISKYEMDTMMYYIANEDTVLPVDSLILGNTGKDGKKTLGQFGEGYKLSLVVLLRLGYKITIFNGNNETWFPEISPSEVFQSDTLKIRILVNDESELPYNAGMLQFCIQGITPEDWTAYIPKNLHLQGEYDKDSTEYGDILYSGAHARKLFVEGLFVCEGDTTYGFNFKNGVIPLDRDRQRVSTFDIQWVTKDMFSRLNASRDNKILKLLDENAEEIRYFGSSSLSTDSVSYKRIARKIYRRFKKTYGETAMPASTERKEKYLRTKYEGAKVVRSKEVIEKAIESTYEYTKFRDCLLKREIVTPKNRLTKFLFNYKDYFTLTLIKAFEDEILVYADQWTDEDNKIPSDASEDFNAEYEQENPEEIEDEETEPGIEIELKLKKYLSIWYLPGMKSLMNERKIEGEVSDE